MLGQVGNWSEHLSVGCDGDMLSWLMEHSPRGAVDVSVTDRREVVLTPTPGGLLPTSAGPRNPLSHYIYTRKEVFDLPRFELHWVAFGRDWPSQEPRLISDPLPPDHQLPWPKLRELKDGTLVEAIEEELLRRMRSVIANGKTRFENSQHPPERLVRLLPPGSWARCMREAQGKAAA